MVNAEPSSAICGRHCVSERDDLCGNAEPPLRTAQIAALAEADRVGP